MSQSTGKNVIIMLTRRWVVLWFAGLAILAGLLLGNAPALAQEGGRVQTLTGQAAPGAGSFYVLPDLEQGQTLYVYAEGISGNLDPFLIVSDDSLDRESIAQEYGAQVRQAIAAGRDPLEVVPEIADRYFLAWDDDSGRGYAAAVEYTIPADGDYKLAVITTPARPTSGDFRLLIGLDQPMVLDGSAQITDDTLAVVDEANTMVNVGVQVVTGTLTLEDPTTFFRLNDLSAGDTLDAFIEATGGDLAPTITLVDSGNKPLATGNFGGQQSSASLSYTFDSDARNYRLAVTACCQDNPTAGDFRLVVGQNAPEAAGGQAETSGRPVLDLPKIVKAGIKLQQITSIDQKSENFGAVASLQLEWQDPGLAFSPDSCDCRFKLFRGDSFFQFATTNDINWPEFTLLNQQGNRWTQNRLVLVNPDGSATYFERFSTTFQAPDFNFERFPFDQQDFYIRVDSIYPEEFFFFENDPTFTEVGDQLGEEEWYITGTDTFVTSEIESTSSTTSRYSFFFEARRHLNFYLFRIFLPVIIIILVSWFTFFLKDYGKRVDVASANLLLFIAFNFTISNDLPRLGYLTLMDTILISTFVVTAFVILFNVYLKRLEVTGKTSFAQTIDQYMIWIYPLAYAAAFIAVTFLFA